jgi:hypothetical protein
MRAKQEQAREVDFPGGEPLEQDRETAGDLGRAGVAVGHVLRQTKFVDTVKRAVPGHDGTLGGAWLRFADSSAHVPLISAVAALRDCLAKTPTCWADALAVWA